MDGSDIDVTGPDEQRLQDITARREWRALVLARTPGADDARELAAHDFELASLEAARGDYAAARVALSEGAAAGAVALVSLHDAAEAEGEIRWPDGTTRRFPAAALNASDWWRALGCALTVRDADALRILVEPSNVDALAAGEYFDEFWRPLCASAARVVRAEPIVDEELSSAAAALEPARITRADPAVIESQLAPLPAVLRALSSGTGFDAALRAALAAWANTSRGLPIELLGLACLARDRGLPFDAAGLPRSLLDRDTTKLPAVSLVFSPRFATHAEDPTAFLDLRGFPRASRRHSLLKRGDDLVAHYELADGSGVPHARAEFQLAGGAAPRFPVAIDPGERLLLAGLHARDVAGVPVAIEFVDQVLACIPAGTSMVPDALFVNARGREVFAREPGAFRRDRLEAYRESLVSAVNAAPGTPTPAPARADPRDAALITIEVIKATVTPLLEKLCRSRDPQLLRSLQPRAGDYALVFSDAATAAAARTAFEAQWSTLPSLTPVRPELARLHVFVAPAGMLATDNELSRNFPGGYRALAPKLEPRRVWVSWKFTRPGETSGGVSFDGLAWIDDHWAWFPKPYRVLSGLAAP